MISQDEILWRQREAQLKATLDRRAQISFAREEGIEEGIEKGIEKGREEGIEKGREEGRREGEKHILVNLLTLRFGAGADWKAMLAPIEAEAALQELTAVIATSDDLEVVKAAIGEATRQEPR